MDEVESVKHPQLLPAHRFKSVQRRHFMWSVALPIMLVASGPLWLPAGWLSWQGYALAMVMWWLVGCLGVTVGLHRLIAHRSFIVAPWLRYLLGGLGQMAAQGSVIYWTALHRCHHTLSDQPGDPHSPEQSARPGMSAMQSFWKGHVGWTVSHDVPKPTRFALELLNDPVAKKLTAQYWGWVAAGWVFPAIVGAACLSTAHMPWYAAAVLGAWWGGALRIAVGHNVIWSINSICHRFGKRPYATNDHSGNVAWLALISWGESWHNNHHHNATSARLGRGWLQPDLGWYCVAALRSLGLATAVRG